MSITIDHQPGAAPERRRDRTHWLYIAVIVAVLLNMSGKKPALVK